MYELVVSDYFSAAHHLRGYKGKCEALHGHNWKVEVTVASDKLDSLGMVADFTDIKKALAETLERYDHRYLNEIEDFKEVNPTTENLARLICQRMNGQLPGGAKVASVAVWESESCFARYIAPER